MDYQENKTIGKCFRSLTEDFNGTVRIFGVPYSYRVVEGIPDTGCMLEVIGYENNYLLVRVNNTLFESDVNFIGLNY